MYCRNCGTEIPDGATQCPKCSQKEIYEFEGKVFKFQYRSGMSSTSVSELDSSVTFQKDALELFQQKSITIFKKKSKPPMTRSVKYQDVESFSTKTSIAPIEIPIILLCILMMLFSSEPLYTIIWIILAAVSIKWAIRSVIQIKLRNGATIKIPYSGKNDISAEFIKIGNTAIKTTQSTNVFYDSTDSPLEPITTGKPDRSSSPELLTTEKAPNECKQVHSLIQKDSSRKKWHNSPVLLGGIAVIIIVVLGFVLISFGIKSKTKAPKNMTTNPSLDAGTEVTPIDDPYESIILKYTQAVDEHWNQIQLQDAGLNYQCAYYTDASQIGYKYQDIDHNGTTELIIGAIGDGFSGYFLDLYTLQDEQPKLVISSGERDRYYLCTNGAISNEGSSGADTSFYCYYTIGSDGTLTLSEALIFDSSYDPMQPWFYSTEGIDVDTASPISEDVASQILNKYVQQAIDFVPLADMLSATEETDDVEDEDLSLADFGFDPDDYAFLCPNFEYDNQEFMYDPSYTWNSTYAAWVPIELGDNLQEIALYLKQCQDIWEETGGKGYSDPTGLIEDPLLPYAEITNPSNGDYDASIDAYWSSNYGLWIPASAYGNEEDMMRYYEKLIAIGEANYAAEH